MSDPCPTPPVVTAKDEDAAYLWLKQYGDTFANHFESDTDTVYDCRSRHGGACTCGIDEQLSTLALALAAARAEGAAAECHVCGCELHYRPPIHCETCALSCDLDHLEPRS